MSKLQALIKISGRGAVYHCMSRVVGGQRLLGRWYFSDGVVLGSRNYVNEVFREFRDRFGARRRDGARPMRGLGALGELATMRDLKVNVVG
ncbi:MAG: hypothetical protein KA191_17355 [Verrucomicrobia bacterium]|jgi:hypothetical protein|nr:hypothetical protein [Verrucomicrobiota bacterium]